MTAPSLTTASAQPGEPGLSHRSKSLSTRASRDFSSGPVCPDARGIVRSTRSNRIKELWTRFRKVVSSGLSVREKALGAPGGLVMDGPSQRPFSELFRGSFIVYDDVRRFQPAASDLLFSMQPERGGVIVLG